MIGITNMSDGHSTKAALTRDIRCVAPSYLRVLQVQHAEMDTRS